MLKAKLSYNFDEFALGKNLLLLFKVLLRFGLYNL